jgi:branched-chain amino acid transport system substrate-binding protein
MMRAAIMFKLILAVNACFETYAQGHRHIRASQTNKQKNKDVGKNTKKITEPATASQANKPKEVTQEPTKEPTKQPMKQTQKPTNKKPISSKNCEACQFTVGVVWAPDYDGYNWTYDAVKLWLSEQTYSDALKGPSVAIGGEECAIDVVFRNSYDNATLALAITKELILQQHALTIIGLESSNVAIPVGLLSNYNKIPMIATTASHANVTSGGPYAFRMGFTNKEQAAVLASFAKYLNATNISIIFQEDNADSVNLANEFMGSWESLEGSVLASVSSSEWNSAYANLSSILASTDILFVPVTPRHLTEVVNFTRGIGWKGPILGGDGWDNLNAIHQCGEACNDSVYTSMLFSNASNPFFESYKSAYGVLPNSMAALAYDAMNLVKKALVTQNKTVCHDNVVSDRVNLRYGLKNTTDFIGVAGNTTFGIDNSPVNRCVILNFIYNSAPTFYHGVC